MLLVKDDGARRHAGKNGPAASRARVTGVRRGHYIEFDFIYGDPDLLVELVMPMPAFRDFCRDQRCGVSAAGPAARSALAALGGASLLSHQSTIKALREIAR